MRIALIGATGFVGSSILKEATDRGHQVTAIARNLEKIAIKNDHISLVKADVNQLSELTDILKGHDAIISAYNPGWDNPNIYADFLKGIQNIEEAVRRSGVKRLLVVGGAGSLYIAPDKQLVETPEFPEAYKAGALAARDYLNLLKHEKELDWTFLSPAIEMHQGTAGIRKGVYRKGLDHPVFNEEGRSVISVEDMSIAILDEIEHPKHIRQRFTVAY